MTQERDNMCRASQVGMAKISANQKLQDAFLRIEDLEKKITLDQVQSEQRVRVFYLIVISSRFFKILKCLFQNYK